MAATCAIVCAALVPGCTSEQEIGTLHPGGLTDAVTNDAPASEHDPQGWINRYVERFAAEHQLAVDWVVVPFNESWLLVGSGKVDPVATNVANFADRESEGEGEGEGEGGTLSEPFLYERCA